MPYVSRDPYWTTARFVGHCRVCGQPIKKGERIFYYPNSKRASCGGDGCGHKEHREFMALAADEALYNA